VPALALTFDDGPDPVWTPRILDALAAARARATFFPIAPRAAEQLELIARMLAEGHAVGLHCDAHVRHTERDEAWLRRDTASALAYLATVGVQPALWRTPWGVVAPWTATVAAEHDLRLVRWTADTHDWRGDGTLAMFERIRDRLVPGAIVLAHDGIGPGARRTDCAQTLASIPRLAALAGARGLDLVALGRPRSPRSHRRAGVAT
jgi:peptidoglycan/xylan/chitin deacetylase (PgdA/CDA1 family)